MNTTLQKPTAPTRSIAPDNRWRSNPSTLHRASVAIPFPSRGNEGADGVHRVMPAFGGDESPASSDRDQAVWSVVLAGGEGERLRPLMERWWGAHRPKQYCTFVGRRSMLQHTLDRAEKLSGAGRRLVVVAGHHEPFFADGPDASLAGAVIAQPQNCGTAAGIFLPLTYIGRQDPDATVVILPSDHFIFPEENFIATLHRAVRAAQQLPDKLVLLGARPDNPETEYGWIKSGGLVADIDGHPVRAVAGFREKPEAHVARELLEAGALWNTFVIAAKWRTLWQLGRECFPFLMTSLDHFAAHLGAATEADVMKSVYDQLPVEDFSARLLQRRPEASVVMELQGVTWSDWGNEERIVEALRRIGKAPLFPTLHPFELTC
ncbi:MAG: sugar phosphate nucleotidyltransferase [Lacunisphaera sp.]